MSQIQIHESDSFIFIDGIRKSMQVLHKNFIYKKHSEVQYRWTECQSLICVVESTLTVSKGPTPHYDHEALSVYRVSEMKAIKRIKERANTDKNVSIKEIY